MSDMKFSRDHDETELTITPLGAAIVEALPDRKRKAAIQRAFKSRNQCPTSIIFPTPHAVEVFYANKGIKIKGVQSRSLA